LAVTVDALLTSFDGLQKVCLEALAGYGHAFVFVVQVECGQLPEDSSAIAPTSYRNHMI
jgi:hypothetical protein